MSDETVRLKASDIFNQSPGIPHPGDPTSDSENSSPDMNLVAKTYLNSSFRRAFDLTVSLSLVAVLAPLLCLIALAIRMSSPGPVLFKQMRYGQGMVPFELLKFRSMYWTGHSEATVKQAIQNDPRVTPLGRILRHTSMDELPQLINIIKGEMSLVGPRPHAVEHDLHYLALIPNYCIRFCARPGLTGLAQISGARGCTPSVEHMQHRIELDLLYLEKASFMFDCHILVRTVNEVLRSQVAC